MLPFHAYPLLVRHDTRGQWVFDEVHGFRLMSLHILSRRLPCLPSLVCVAEVDLAWPSASRSVCLCLPFLTFHCYARFVSAVGFESGKELEVFFK